MISRGDNVVKVLGRDSVEMIVDLAAGPQWPELLGILKRGGRYVRAGAIAGPIVQLDIRTLYLKAPTFYGCTFQPDAVFENLVRYIQDGEIRPVVAAK